MAEQTIRVEIYNQTYSIRSDGDNDYIQDLAEYVDSKMREISSGTMTVDSLKVAILAAPHRRRVLPAKAQPIAGGPPARHKKLRMLRDARSAVEAPRSRTPAGIRNRPLECARLVLAKVDCVPRHRTQLQLSQHMNAGRPMPAVGAIPYGAIAIGCGL